MILTKSETFTKDELRQLQEQFGFYIKTVIDIKKKICSAGCDLHADSKKILLKQASQQEDIWGGGINVETREIDFNSFINIRPQQGNKSIEIQNQEIRDTYEELTNYFFQNL